MIMVRTLLAVTTQSCTYSHVCNTWSAASVSALASLLDKSSTTIHSTWSQSFWWRSTKFIPSATKTHGISKLSLSWNCLITTEISCLSWLLSIPCVHIYLKKWWSPALLRIGITSTTDFLERKCSKVRMLLRATMTQWSLLKNVDFDSRKIN